MTRAWTSVGNEPAILAIVGPIGPLMSLEEHVAYQALARRVLNQRTQSGLRSAVIGRAGNDQLMRESEEVRRGEEDREQDREEDSGEKGDQ